jgi:hypothetical protein
MTTESKPHPKPDNNIVPPGHRYINDYYGYYINNGKADDVILLGQWNEFDLYALRQRGSWSLGARWSNEGSEYLSSGFGDSLNSIARDHLLDSYCPATRIAAIRLAAHLFQEEEKAIVRFSNRETYKDYYKAMEETNPYPDGVLVMTMKFPNGESQKVMLEANKPQAITLPAGIVSNTEKYTLTFTGVPDETNT